MKLSILSTAATLLCLTATTAFVPSKLHSSREALNTLAEAPYALSDVRTGKPTGTSFLPHDTIERAKVGSPPEKAKLAKDGTSAWVDIYEYARKIREGEITWEEIEKADLDTVSGT